MKPFRTALLLLASAAALGAPGCGSSGEGGDLKGQTGTGASDGGPDFLPLDSGASGSTGGTGSQGGAGTAAAGGGGVAGSGPGGSGSGGRITSVTPVPRADACATDTLQGEAGVLDVFIMLDRSGSMDDATAAGPSKWEVITQAIDDFVTSPQSAGIGAGLGFFGLGSGDTPSCDVADYAAPAVPIALLNGNAGPINTAIGGQTPAGRTPTEPALEGALDYAAQWAAQHPTHTTIVVLATDGAPNGCNSDPAGAAAIAASGLSGSPSVQTYVIGVIGEGTGDGNCPNGPVPACGFVQTLNGIARGGGTGSAFIVNTSADPGQQFLDALNAIRNANQVGCTFTIPAPPSGRQLDFSRATVRYTPGTGAAQSLPWKASAAACGTDDGWRYNRATAPRSILLCDTTCQTVMADPDARIDVLLACQPPGTNGTGGAGNTGGGSNVGGGGGTAGAGNTGGAGGSTPCLLTGQSCTTDAECCGGTCRSGVCSLIR